MNKGKLNIHCSINSDKELPKEFSIGTNAVNYTDYRSNEEFSFEFDQIHQQSSLLDPNSDSYDSILAPLVKKTTQGASTICIMCGSPKLDTSFFIPSSQSSASSKQNKKNSTSNSDLTGFLKKVTAQLLSSREDKGCVTFSWFNLESTASEQITDVLRSASNPKGKCVCCSECLCVCVL